MRTALAFSSAGYLFDVFPDMAPAFPRIGVSGRETAQPAIPLADATCQQVPFGELSGWVNIRR